MDDSYIIDMEICNIDNNIIIENEDSIMSIEFIEDNDIIARSIVVNLNNLEL